MCGRPGDEGIDFVSELCSVLCGRCQLKVKEKNKQDEISYDCKIEEFSFCKRCRMEFKVYTAIGFWLYDTIRSITSESVLQYFLLKRKEGKRLFFEKWIEPGSKSGIAFYSALNPDDKIYFIVEDCGIGTINPKTFAEERGGKPIQRIEYKDYWKAREGLGQLMKENLEMIEGEFQKVSPSMSDIV